MIAFTNATLIATLLATTPVAGGIPSDPAGGPALPRAAGGAASVAPVAPAPAPPAPPKPVQPNPPATTPPAVGPSSTGTTTVVPEGPAPAREAAASADPAMLALLDDLEHAADSLRDFGATLVYEKFDALSAGSDLQYGTIVFERKEGKTRLGVFFDEYVDASGRKEAVQQRFVFADGWLTEIDPGRKQVIRRQVVPPGKAFDPLKLGEGPFPLPIGQRRAEVLARFEVSAAPPPSDRLLASIDEAAIAEGRVRTLRLVPRSGSRDAEDFARVDLYYDRESLLPLGVVAESPEGNRKIVRLAKLKLNQGVSAESEARLSTEAPGDWTVDVRPWQE